LIAFDRNISSGEKGSAKMLVFAVVACLEGLTRGRVGGKSTRKEKAKENAQVEGACWG